MRKDFKTVNCKLNNSLSVSIWKEITFMKLIKTTEIQVHGIYLIYVFCEVPLVTWLLEIFLEEATEKNCQLAGTLTWEQW